MQIKRKSKLTITKKISEHGNRIKMIISSKYEKAEIDINKENAVEIINHFRKEFEIDLTKL